MFRIKNLFLLLVFLVPSSILSQDMKASATYTKEWYVSKKDTMPYRLLLPKHYDQKKTYPLLVFLHGSGERGHDNELQLVHGSNLFLNESHRENYPMIVVFPQCDTNKSWNNSNYSRVSGRTVFSFPAEVKSNDELKLLEGLLKEVENTYAVDSSKIYLGGLSMGGMGTFEMLHRNPNRFAAAFAICGGANPNIAAAIDNTPLWIFHGEKDNVVPAYYSKKMFEALKKQNAPVQLTLYPEADHDSWTAAFAEPELLPWLYSQSLAK